ncbi:MAG: hypothetical protein K2Y39_23560 [Candidatus Obscuribacterales bacterium]|nr:hypothetical protein [Candidatus Obscuribacterales bacterium]
MTSIQDKQIPYSKHEKTHSTGISIQSNRRAGKQVYACMSFAIASTVFLGAADLIGTDALAQGPNGQKADSQIAKPLKPAETKAESGRTAAPVFSIEVPGPSQKADPNSREQAASQYFKDKQKQTISANPKVKEASMRLSGSLCPACLKALASRFQKTEGVITASVELPSQMKASETETSNALGKLPRYAIAHVTFDAKVLTVERIKDIIKSNDLAYWKFEVTEK